MIKKLKIVPCELNLANPWKIAGSKGSAIHHVIVIELTDADGVTGFGEAAPSRLYGESSVTATAFFNQIDVRQLSFADVSASMNYLATLTPPQQAAQCALNIALLDGAAKLARKPIYEFLGLGFRENHHVTSFSIGIDAPEIICQKVLDAAVYPVLKLKVGDPRDHENFIALRSVAPEKPVRVDANEGWQTKEEALRQIEWLVAQDRHIQFVEQPMPRATDVKDMVWLKARSPLPLIADESYHTAKDLAYCAEGFHGVNVKLVKTGGISVAYDALQAARKVGLKTMIGCMIETSVLITAAAHLAELADFLDIEGNLLITNDPYAGVTAEKGILSFASAQEKFGLRVNAR